MSDSYPDIERLLPVVRTGSSDALGAVLEAYRGYLLAIASDKLDPALLAKGGASDIVQETFLEAHRDFVRFHGQTGTELRAWLVQLLLNNLANFSRQYKATRKRQVAREVELPGNPSSADGGMGDGSTTPSVALMAQERAAEVDRILARLPADYQQVITLRNQEDRPFAEIAALMDRSENAVRRLWLRAVERIRQELDATP